MHVAGRFAEQLWPSLRAVFPDAPSAPLLEEVAGDFIITSNPDLTSIAFDALQSVDNVTIENNAMLPCTQAMNLASGITVTGTTTISGNSGC